MLKPNPLVLAAQKTVEVPSQMHFRVPRRIFVVNEIDSIEFVIEPEEDCSKTATELNHNANVFFVVDQFTKKRECLRK